MKNVTENDIRKVKRFVRFCEIESIAEGVLLLAGFRSNLAGTRYLKTAIVLRYTNTDALLRDLYAQIAENNLSSANSVERSIRHSINDCHRAGGLTRLNDFTCCQLVSSDYPPTSGEFISTVCTWIRLEKSDVSHDGFGQE